jgi:DNA processing protein
MKNEAHSGSLNERAETVALLALLRTAPRGVTWGDIAGAVRFAGSAQTVLEQSRDAQDTLFPDPTLDEAVERANAELTQWENAGLDLVTVLSDRYPTRLAGVFDCPPFLFVRGQVVPDDRGMSVVGSRKSSPEGVAMARDAARLLAERGLTVIAGLAEGIDTAAHREALALGARTVAVIGTGITQYYPAANRALQDEIAAEGLVISQFYPDQPPTQTTFPMRNGTMSGYGLATIVVEAGENSGSRIQARKAADHGRPVILSQKVARLTTWGADLARKPWVYVAASRDELAGAIDQVLSDSSDEFLESLGLIPT